MDTSPAETVDRATAKSIAQSSLLELVWSAFGVAATGFGLAGYEPRYMLALAPVAFGIALIARSGALASRWPRPGRRVGIIGDLFGALVCLGLGAIVLLTSLPPVVVGVPALVLGGLLVADGPIQAELAGKAAERRGIATAMTIAGLTAIVLSVVAFLVVPSVFPLLLAMWCIGMAHVVASGVTFARLTRRAEQRS